MSRLIKNKNAFIEFLMEMPISIRLSACYCTKSDHKLNYLLIIIYEFLGVSFQRIK